MHSPLAQLVWSFTQRNGLLRTGEEILVAVSGGPDSMALLEVLRELAPKKGLVLHVAHVHHMLRGAEADADREFVRRYARFVGISCTSLRVDVPSRRRAQGGSLEEVSRLLRYQALEKVRMSRKMTAIATAHHADDQRETVLMRVRRGTDVWGLAGILPRLTSPPVVRPMLNTSRREIMAYLDDRRIPYRYDSSNDDIHMMRNQIRLRTVPLMQRHGECDFLRVLPDLADVSRRLGIHLKKGIPSLLAPAGEPSIGERAVPLSALRNLPAGIRRTAISLQLSAMGIELSTERIDRVLHLVSRDVGKRIVFRSSGVHILRDRHHLVFIQESTHRARPVRLRPGGSVRSGDFEVCSKRPGVVPRSFPTDRNLAWIDADKVEGELLVRPWKPGDRIRPLGMGGRTKKVSDLLRDAHVSPSIKERIPVVTHRGRIIWVCGVRPDERFKVTEETRHTIQLSCHSYV